MQQRKFLILFLFICLPFFGQAQDDAPQPTFESPYNTMYVHLYYLQPEHQEPNISGKALRGVAGERGAKLAIKLKQVLDGEGLRVLLGKVPEDQEYKDTATGKFIYTPFPKERPEIYLERTVGGRWLYSRETVEAIPQMHREVYPWGTDMLLSLLPQIGTSKFLGLHLWQWISLGGLILLVFVLHFIVSRLFSFLIRMATRTQIGKNHFARDIVWKIAKALSLLVVVYAAAIFLPVIQLPIDLNTYLLTGVELFQTYLITLLAIRAVKFGRLYFQRITERTENNLDDQLLPFIIRTINVIIITAGFLTILGIVGVNVAALIAGISIGGLALALAAQDTVKNLLGSIMIFVDRPFQIGDFISCGEIVGTVEEVGFRSTRIRTVGTSLIAIPNGKLADMIVDNLGVRTYRRFKTNIGVTYDTPPDLLEKYVAALRELNQACSFTRNDLNYIYFNNLGGSSLDIMFVVYIDTTLYDEQLAYGEELYFAIIRLAHTLGIRIAFPSTTVYVEDFPEKQSLVPDYQEEMAQADSRMTKFLEDFKQQQAAKKEES